ncbi:uncharacterized protein DC041_0008390 [Schistosoma bovis]|uniref:Uncharacterized protein n=1 Tax=Schistosoma bovis TaxID=6184 RepID=A0A430QDG2_SCHBO|nr:uncharacterized protein DC041_0008390 [Schistosoma bovis]
MRQVDYLKLALNYLICLLVMLSYISECPQSVTFSILIKLY